MAPDKSKIEELKKSLYSRTAQDIRPKHAVHFHQQEFEVKTGWDEPQKILDDAQSVQTELNDHYEDHSMSFFTKLLIASGIFFLIALGIGGYLVLNGSNIVSANNVDIQVSGPVSVAGGDPLSLGVQVVNKNNVELTVVDLTVDFPDGTANPDDVSKSLTTYQQLMDDIAPGGMSQKTVRAALFGEENSKKEILVKVQYRVPGSNAIFYKEKTYEVLISSSPLSIKVDSYGEVNSGQEFDTTVTLTSNSKDILKNLVLKGTYPTGFTFISSNLQTSGNNATWKIGDLPPKSKKTIVIKGRLDGQDDEDRIFRFISGAASAKNDKTIGTQYIAGMNEVKIKKPFLSVGVELDGDSTNETHISSFDNPIEVEVSWFNNLESSVIDGEIHVKLSGNAFDKVAVSPGQGFYQSANNEIIWNKITTPDLSTIDAGGSGKVIFTVTPKNPKNSVRPITNPEMNISVSVKGNRISEANVPEAISSSASRHIAIAPDVNISGQIVRSIGPFVNTGPIPPQAEKETTYTVLWTVYNTSSDASNAQVVATLPAYVKWGGKVSPEDEAVTFNSVNGQVTWNIGNVPAYTGSSATKKTVAFQVILTPSVAQVGAELTLINQATLTATDNFTGVSLKSTQEARGTALGSDPAFKTGDERVVQ
ncbi:MAG: hypothetical protein RIT04_624 [Candidatus Parcubacteria bacterium]|jgi:hypothetical protein